MFLYLLLKEVAPILSIDCHVMPNPKLVNVDENGLILEAISNWKDTDL